MAVLLGLLVFGILSFGLVLSFKQDLTRAAAEGARAGAVAVVGAAWTDADEATREAVQGFDRSCGVDGMQCYVNLHDCAAPVATRTPSDPWSSGDCVTVELVYDYAGYPLLPRVPVLAGLLPDQVRSTSVARVNT